MAQSNRGGFRPGNRNNNRGRPQQGGSRGRPAGGGQGPAQRPAEAVRPAKAPEAPSRPKEIELPPQTTVRELADLMGCGPIELIKALMNAGVMANINQQIDHDTATIVAEDMGYTVVEPKAPEPEQVQEETFKPMVGVRRRTYSQEEEEFLHERPPVVTILGHVDHGKTSLLDVIRTTNVQAGEAGGITQHIGAYQIEANGKTVTFLDTPGHAAFTAMRARGAQVTDIAVLVVAADDGVQPQTREAISHARAAQVPIIVAINKIDLPSANLDNVKQQLGELGLVPEEWGGETIVVPVSARTKQGISQLLDMVLLVAEMANYKANPRANAEGAVVEGKLDRSRGPTATLLVEEGILKPGDTILVGETYGKIRAMFDHRGKPLKRATPSTPVVVMGLDSVPKAGDRFQRVESEKAAREAVDQLKATQAEAQSQPTGPLTLEQVYAQAQAGQVQTLNLVLKVDVQGSLEPIHNSLDQIDVSGLKVRFVHEGVGTIGEADVMLALASSAIIVGFSVEVDPAVGHMPEAAKVSIRTYDIIYRLIEDIQLALKGMLEPEYRDVVTGRAVVRSIFRVPKIGQIAGVQVTEGKALRSATARVMRGTEKLFQGQVGSLRRFTEDAREVGTGLECGVGLDGFGAFEVDDVIEFLTKERVN